MNVRELMRVRQNIEHEGEEAAFPCVGCNFKYARGELKHQCRFVRESHYSATWHFQGQPWACCDNCLFPDAKCFSVSCFRSLQPIM